jgi:dTDP-glucose pyrophosphorylase
MRVDFDRITVSVDSHIIDAIKAIDNGRLQAALVVDDQNRLKGIVTDGDIRRGLLRGLSLSSPLREVMNPHPVTVQEHEPREAAIRQIRDLGTRHLPIVDTRGRLVALELLSDADPVQPEVAVLMAGGLGTRLRPLTETIPKPLVTVGDTPILEVILRHLVQQGVRRFFISVNYKAEMIEDYFGNGSKWGVSITYLRENEKMGTAGALSLLPEKPQTPFLLMNGDIMTSINLKQMFEYHMNMRAAATVGAFAHEYEVPYGVLEMEDGHVTRIEEKPIIRRYVSGGVYVLSPSVLELIVPGEPLDVPALIGRLLSGSMQVVAFPIREYWIDIGRHDDLQRASREVTQIFPAQRCQSGG